ncbi:Endonuclease/exonuclease/phosphatase [Scheffersomyces amazonensis]|uniref:Endonuclease/exonuclease/phosphatase n=1 Tax=Scheffersomyces amazonensis TaxID=1078765 RepID=UPI00315DB94C
MAAMSESTPLIDTSVKEFNNQPKIQFRRRTTLFKSIIVPLVILIILTVYTTANLIKVDFSEHEIRGEDGVSLKLPHFLSRPLSVRIYTNNIRFDNVNYPDKGEKSWTRDRKKQVVNSIDFHTGSLGHANVVCLQEVLYHQLQDVLEGLNTNADNEYQKWSFYGIGRDDGEKAGEFSPIFYKRKDWTLLENETYWLSETPSTPSKGWDAVLPRIVTQVTLQSKINPLVKINVFNTHFDHKGRLARKKSAQLIVDKMENYNDYPSFLCGDFNTEPSDQPYKVLSGAGFKDSRLSVARDFAYGEESTFTGFDKENEITNSIIDYVWSPYYTKSIDDDEDEEEGDNVFIGLSNYFNSEQHKHYKIIIKQFGILHNFFKGFYFSDHRPVVATYEISRTSLFAEEENLRLS